jgi:hypothetical protein
MRECGGSGCNQFLIGSPYARVRQERSWTGVPADAVKAVSVHEFE